MENPFIARVDDRKFNSRAIRLEIDTSPRGIIARAKVSRRIVSRSMIGTVVTYILDTIESPLASGRDEAIDWVYDKLDDIYRGQL